MRDQDANKSHKAEDLKYTDAGRKVYSGGGVEPDRRFDGPTEGFNPGRFARTIRARSVRHLRPAVHASGRRARHADLVEPREVAPAIR